MSDHDSDDAAAAAAAEVAGLGQPTTTERTSSSESTESKNPLAKAKKVGRFSVNTPPPALKPGTSSAAASEDEEGGPLPVGSHVAAAAAAAAGSLAQASASERNVTARPTVFKVAAEGNPEAEVVKVGRFTKVATPQQPVRAPLFPSAPG